MTTKIFIDGKEGTTGLQIYERFENRTDIEILLIDEDKRKDAQERKRLIHLADIVFLCLPDVAAKEAVALAEGSDTIIIDASTAHRTNPAWAYGFPELSKELEQKIIYSKRIAVPGCHATGFIALIYPLIKGGILSSDYPTSCHSITGYSGGGKAMIAEYTNENRVSELDSPRQYGIGLKHKHLPEMTAIAGLDYPPVFNPIVADFYSGMVVSVPIHTRLLNKKVSASELHEFLMEYYKGAERVKVMPFMGEGVLTDGFLASNTLSGTNDLQIFVTGHDEQIMLMARFDNLGKGASGAAVQCMDLILNNKK